MTVFVYTRARSLPTLCQRPSDQSLNPSPSEERVSWRNSLSTDFQQTILAPPSTAPSGTLSWLELSRRESESEVFLSVAPALKRRPSRRSQFNQLHIYCFQGKGPGCENLRRHTLVIRCTIAPVQCDTGPLHWRYPWYVLPTT